MWPITSSPSTPTIAANCTGEEATAPLQTSSPSRPATARQHLRKRYVRMNWILAPNAEIRPVEFEVTAHLYLAAIQRLTAEGRFRVFTMS